MNNNRLSSTGLFRVVGLIIFDVALLLASFRILGLFLLISTDKSIFALFVLIVGLMIFNSALISPNSLFKSIGMPYSVSIISLFILYPIVANIFSIFLILGSLLWYIVWELVLFAIFIFVSSIIFSFSKSAVGEIRRSDRELIEKNSVKLKLIEIEAALEAKKKRAELSPSINSFLVLKERIQASTPFGRIIDNNLVLDLENQINDNLTFLIEMLKSDLTDTNLLELKKIIENTLKLVINREALNIK